MLGSNLATMGLHENKLECMHAPSRCMLRSGGCSRGCRCTCMCMQTISACMHACYRHCSNPRSSLSSSTSASSLALSSSCATGLAASCQFPCTPPLSKFQRACSTWSESAAQGGRMQHSRIASRPRACRAAAPSTPALLPAVAGQLDDEQRTSSSSSVMSSSSSSTPSCS